MVKALEDYEYFRTDNGVLYQGDCLEILPLLEDESVDLVLTDPPYGLGKSNLEWEKKGYKRISEEWDSKIPPFMAKIRVNSFLCFSAFPCLNEMLAEGGDCGFSLNAIIVWDKISTMPNITARGYQFTHEFIIWWTKEKNYYWDNTEQTRDIIHQTWSESGREHPTQKPVKLILGLLKNHSEKGNLILDPFLGSGTTAVACEELGRRWIGIELSKDYCEIAKKRLEAWKGQTRFF